MSNTYGSQDVGAQGTATAPTAGAAIATIASGSLPAGIYRVTVTVGYLAGTVAAAEDNNFELRKAAIVITRVFAARALNVPTSVTFDNIILDGSQAISVNATGAGSVGVVYSAAIKAVRVS